MGEGTQRPVGERRRRREAARAAELAAEQAGSSRPPTRRELRWREAEEAARLEAIATGELRIGEVRDAVGRSVIGDSATPPARETRPAPDADVSGAEDVATGEHVSAPSAPTATSAATAPASSAATGSSAPTAPARPPSRRSLRDRVPDSDSLEAPAERTATGRRPVVRTPTTAQGIRVLDATGQLSGIQPVVRPDEPAPWEPRTGAPGGAAAAARPAPDLDQPVRTARDALAASSVPPAAAPSAGSAPRTAAPGATAGSSEPAAGPDQHAASDESPDSGEFTLRPRWVAIGTIADDDAAASVPLSRRSIRTTPSGPVAGPGTPVPPAPEDEPPAPSRNPAVTVVKVAVLVAVAVILGALIWLLGSEALSDDSAAAPHTIVTTPYLEETSAR